MFKNLHRVLVHAFSKREIISSDYIKLTKIEKELLVIFLKRKFLCRKAKLKSLDLRNPTCENLNLLVKNKILRESEECHKFVVVRLFNHVREELSTKSEDPVTLHRMHLDYFKEDAARLGIPIHKFQYPLLKNTNSVIGFNMRFFRIIFTSEKMKEAAKSFVKSHLIENHRIEISKTLNSRVAKLEKQYKELSLKSKGKSDFLDRIRLVKDNILPWTLDECRQSKKKFLKLMLKCAITTPTKKIRKNRRK